MSKPSDFEKGLKHYYHLFSDDRIRWLKHNLPHIEKAYSSLDSYSDDYIKCIFTGSRSYRIGGVVVQHDHFSDYVNVKYGCRVTTGVPLNYNRSIHFIGTSNIYGMGVEDKHTIPSFFQEKVNHLFPDTYRVVNYGIRGMRMYLYYDKLRSICFRKGDIVIVQFPYDFKEVACELAYKYDIPYFSLKNVVQRPHQGGEIFIDYGHFNHFGNKLFANEFVKLLFEKEYDTKVFTSFLHDRVSQEKKDIDEYLKYLRSFKRHFGTVGSVGINGNPFTLGHKALIEMAASMVDHLYVFVIEEDRSYFSFEERWEMISEGTKDITNVTLVKSGRFYLSYFTFPEYFDKDVLQNELINPSKDIAYYVNYIAPTLGISKRFVGEEPRDRITKQHNEYMKTYMPNYGIEFIEIPRLKYNNEIISASVVRECIKKGESGKLKKLVPESTYRLLSSNNYIYLNP